MASPQTNWYDFPEITWKSLFHPSFSYEYFRQALPLPDAGTKDVASCNPVTAAWMADAAMLAYGRLNAGEMDLLEFDRIMDRVGMRGHRLGNWNPEAKSVKAIFAYCPEFAVLAFRGTRSINWVNSIVDIAAIPVREGELLDPHTLSPIDRSPEDVTDATEKPRNPMVHSGFQFGFNTGWPDIALSLETFRKTFPTAPIFFTGHSMGAAFATIAVARFKGGRAALYTFGSPRVGNNEFCETVRERADLGVFRFVNNDDVMPTVPPEEKTFVHTCGLMRIDADGNVSQQAGTQDKPRGGFVHIIRDFEELVGDYMKGVPPPSALTDHAQRRYCYYLWRWAHHGQVP